MRTVLRTVQLGVSCVCVLTSVLKVCSQLKQHYVEVGILCDLPPPPHTFWMQHAKKYKSHVGNNLSDVM